MGCGASRGSHLHVSAPEPVSNHGDAANPEARKRDLQTFYRERLGSDFLEDFAKSQEDILDLQRKIQAATQSPGSILSAASTPTREQRSEWIHDQTIPASTPYTPPPIQTLPGGNTCAKSREDHNPNRGPDSSDSPQNDSEGPKIDAISHVPVQRHARKMSVDSQLSSSNTARPAPAPIGPQHTPNL